MMVIALLFLLAGPSQATGDLIVNVAAGTEVYVDGELYGVASTDGQTVRGLAPGPHKVMLHAPNGGTANFNVNIIEAKVQTINVSPLGFRMKPKSETPVAAVRIVSDETPCTVTVGDVVAEKTQHELNVGTVPTGRQKLSIVCGEKRVDSILTLAPDEMQIIEPDFNRRIANVIAHRRRVTVLTVEGGQSEIVSANIPVEWKRALSAAAGESKALSVTPINITTVIVTYRAPTMNSANAVIDRLRNTDIVDRAEPTGNAQKTPDGVVFTVRVKFRVAGVQPR
jgi:hypothetical protein